MSKTSHLKNCKIKNAELTVLLAFLAFWTITNIFFVYKNDILEITLITFIIIALIYIGIRNREIKWKILCLSSALYIFIRALLLPLMFVYTLNNDNGIVIDEAILRHERETEIRRLNSYFSPSDTSNINALQSLLTSKDLLLSEDLKSVSFFWGDNPVNVVDTFTIEESSKIIGWGRSKSIFIIKGKSGKHIATTSIRYPTEREKNDRSIQLVVTTAIEHLKIFQERVSERRSNLENNKKIWTYSMILPYVAFDNDTMKFQKPMAVSIHGFSNLICNALLLALIGTAVFDILNKERKKVEK